MTKPESNSSQNKELWEKTLALAKKVSRSAGNIAINRTVNLHYGAVFEGWLLTTGETVYPIALPVQTRVRRQKTTEIGFFNFYGEAILTREGYIFGVVTDEDTYKAGQAEKRVAYWDFDVLDESNPWIVDEASDFIHDIENSLTNFVKLHNLEIS